MSAKKSKHDEDVPDDEIRLNLEGFAPHGEDRDGIVLLLRQLFPKDCSLHYGELADFIIEQNSIGTVVKNEYNEIDTKESFSDDDGDDIVFSLTTVISLSETTIKRSPIVLDLCKYLESFVSQLESPGSDSRVLMRLLSGESSERPGLLINERFVNLPPSIAAESVAALPKEVESLPEVERPTQLVVLTRTIKSPESDEMLYIQPEMELVRKAAFAVAEKKITNYNVEGESEEITYVVMGIKLTSLPEILDLIASAP